ncbi:hypothetical protein ACPPVT_06580 [Angustibacter sp. McL0619]|uniref:hypothetical protein n=1 Tax=Angustibacter sp. McL0619 TaxID=3415676 RepID=UPI003CFB836C
MHTTTSTLSPTTTPITTPDEDGATAALPKPHPQGRRLRRAVVGGLAAAIAAGLLSIGAAAPANATGTTGAYTQTVCGWYIQPGAPSSFVDSKITKGTLPWVSGTSTANQLVWVQIRFWHPGGAAGWYVYRTAWYYTYARAGVWTKTWTNNANGWKNQTLAQDEAPESGYTGGEFTSLDTRYSATISWMTGSTVTGTVSNYATAPYNSNNMLVCNGGANH